VSDAVITVGTLAPDFSLPDIDGTRWTRAALMGTRGLVIHFLREFT
jgi:peroxiredoxin